MSKYTVGTFEYIGLPMCFHFYMMSKSHLEYTQTCYTLLKGSSKVPQRFWGLKKGPVNASLMDSTLLFIRFLRDLSVQGFLQRNNMRSILSSYTSAFSLAPRSYLRYQGKLFLKVSLNSLEFFFFFLVFLPFLGLVCCRGWAKKKKNL